jgi:RNA-directed DNA polymerase
VKKIKVHSLTGRITSDLMRRAFRNVKRNRGAAGIDKVSITMFEANLDQNLLALMRDLKTRDGYTALPLRRTYIPKDSGQGQRPLGIPVVRDRVAQEVLRLLLSPIFERMFHDDSYGFRPRRNCHMAVEKILELRRLDYNYVLDADIQRFFDNLPHDIIMTALRAEVADGNILDLVEKFLKAGVMEDGVFQPTWKGTPQGGVISPLLANIALNSLDWQLHNAGFHFVRYADDFVVLCQREAQVAEAQALVQQHLTSLGLTLSPEKTKLTEFREGFAFLGFAISSWSVTMRPRSEEKFKAKIKALTRRSHNLDDEIVTKLNQVIRGTANYFATTFSRCTELFRRLDRWIRMRIRCMKFKRKSRADNGRMRLQQFRKRGLLALSDLRPNPV